MTERQRLVGFQIAQRFARLLHARQQRLHAADGAGPGRPAAELSFGSCPSGSTGVENLRRPDRLQTSRIGSGSCATVVASTAACTVAWRQLGTASGLARIAAVDTAAIATAIESVQYSGSAAAATSCCFATIACRPFFFFPQMIS